MQGVWLRRGRILVWLLLLSLWQAFGQADFVPPPAPEGWQFGTFPNVDGARLRYGGAQGKGPNTLVFFGGYTEFAEKYFETMRHFQQLGYSVWFLDWRGQGGSDRYLPDRQKAVLEDLAKDAADARRFLRQVVRSAPERTCLVSHSLGGLITMRLLHDHPKSVACAVFSSPTFQLGTVAPYPYWLLRARVTWGIRLGWRHEYIGDGRAWQDGEPAARMAESLTSSKERQPLTAYWFRTKPELQLGSVTYAWSDAFLHSSNLVLREEYLQAIDTPSLISSAGLDQLASLPAQRYVARTLPKGRLVSYPEARHELFLEREPIRQAWLKAMEGFLHQELPKP